MALDVTDVSNQVNHGVWGKVHSLVTASAQQPVVQQLLAPGPRSVGLPKAWAGLASQRHEWHDTTVKPAVLVSSCNPATLAARLPT